MFSNKIFLITLIVSALVHGVLLWQNPDLNPFPRLKEIQKVEVSYVKAVKAPKPELEAESSPRKEPLLKLPERITVDRKLPPPYLNKEAIFKENKALMPQEVSFAKPAFAKSDIVGIKKKITLPPVELDKVNNPIYLSYYQIVREKIKRSAYQNFTGKEVGEVTVSFVILRDGSLQELRLVEEKSSPSAYLREIALRSVKDASGFPSFPKELDYPRLSFNLAITFEVE